jgi:DNA-directed RNA polymerase subunit RPC12/RpoP
VAVQCPYCQHRMSVKGVHAGRFLPACDRCGDTFMLVIPADPGAPMIVTTLDEARRKLKSKKGHR